MRPASGVHAHAYQLVIPALLRPACERTPWRRGRIHTVRAAFRDLGLAAAQVYEILEQLAAERAGPTNGRTIADRARLSPDTTYTALNTLAAWGLTTRTPAGDGTAGGWILGDASLAQLAEEFGVVDAVADQLRRYRHERAVWRAWLASRGRVILDVVPIDAHPRYQHEHDQPPPLPAPPAGVDQAGPALSLGEVLALLRDELGGRVIA